MIISVADDSWLQTLNFFYECFVENGGFCSCSGFIVVCFFSLKQLLIIFMLENCFGTVCQKCII